MSFESNWGQNKRKICFISLKFSSCYFFFTPFHKHVINYLNDLQSLKLRSHNI